MKSTLAIACALIAGAFIAGATESPTASSESPATESAAPLIDKFLHSGEPGLTSYRARRILQASTMGGRLAATLEAVTHLDVDGAFSYEVVSQTGSGLIRDRVLLGALEAEARSRNHKESSQAELSPANYEFQLGQESGGLVPIRLLPRRKSPMLVNGTVTVNQHDGDVVRIDGSLTKTPSWWTRHVDIVRRYERVAGVRVPVEMSSHADVRMAGAANFTMTYEYTMVNGRPIVGTK